MPANGWLENGITGPIQVRIQRGIVVHLELAIGLVPLAAGEQVVGKLLGGAGQVVVLGQGDRQLAADAFAVLGRGIGAVALLDQVIDPQGQDRQPVDRAAERFGVLRGSRRGQRRRGGPAPR